MHVVYIYLQNIYGHNKDSKTIFFDNQELKENEPAINYLFGQLEDVHKRTYYVSPKSSSLTYNGTIWTKDTGILMKFLHLGRALDIISPFFKDPQQASLRNIEPTLSPRDPNFDAWYKNYQIKMNKTQRAPSGMEYGD